MTNEKLLFAAKEARKKAYCPYSHFAVGAALLSADGRIFTGCNVENASFGATICAERAALASAVSAGVKKFTALAIAGGKDDEEARSLCPPCGICRQALSEFFGDDLPVYLCGEDGAERVTLGELLPLRFSSEQL